MKAVLVVVVLRVLRIRVSGRSVGSCFVMLAACKCLASVRMGVSWWEWTW